MKLSAEDRRWAIAVKEEAKWSCRRCFKYFPEGRARMGLHAHHIFTRKRRSTRHAIDNGVALCYGHHRWAHANPLEFHEWIKGEIGEQEYDYLMVRSRDCRKTGPKTA